MKIKSVHIENFRQFRDFKINFEVEVNEKNITVIRAANSTGKTTFMQAIKWCLFGDEAVELEKPMELLNRDYIKETRYGSDKEAFYRVVLEIVENDTTVKINRTQNLNVTPARVTKKSTLVALEYMDDNGETRVIRNHDKEREQIIQKRINSLLSIRMVNYFLFDGERIERLSSDGTAGKREISDAITAVSSLPIINNSIETLKSLSRDVRKDKAKSVSDKNFQYVSDKITELELAVEENDKKIVRFNSEKEDSEKKLKEVEAKLSGMENVSLFQEKRKHLERENERLIAQNEKVYKQIQSLYLEYSTARYIYMLQRKFQKLELETNKDVKSIPFMKANAIDAIIKNETCICGTQLEQEHIKKLKEQRVHQPPESNEAMMKNYEIAINKEVSNLNNNVKQIKNLVQEYNQNFSIISENNVELQDINEKISKLPHDEIQLLNKKRKELNESIVLLKHKIDFHITENNDMKKQLQQCEETVIELTTKLKFNEVLNVKEEMLKETLEILHLEKEKDEKALRENVEKHANTHFREIITKDKRIKIDDKFNLKVLEDDGTEASISSGESVAVSISIILSIIDTFRMNLMKSKKDGSNLMSEKDFFLVMDGPFAMLDQYFSKKISVKLSDSIEQIILLTNDIQYNDSIKEAFRAKTSKEFLLNIPPIERKDSIYTEDLVEVIL